MKTNVNAKFKAAVKTRLGAEKPAAKKAAKTARYTTELGEYKGKPTITIVDTEAANPMFSRFSFGAGKAKMILAVIDDIQSFVDDNS